MEFNVEADYSCDSLVEPVLVQKTSIKLILRLVNCVNMTNNPNFYPCFIKILNI